MKTIRRLCALIAVLSLLLTACRTKEVVTVDNPATDDASFVQKDFLQMVNKNVLKTQFVTSKLKFSAKLGGQKVSVGGSLKMKRDDVIRIQLVALGIMEAGRLEFTKDYVLIMDRVNKQYVKASYNDIEFLRANGINFYTLQSLFWNELFQPGRQKPSAGDFSAVPANDSVIIGYDKGKLSYQWNANKKTGQILSANVKHQKQDDTGAQLDWNYGSFKSLKKQKFPTDMQVSVKAKGKTLQIGLVLSSLDTDEDWDARTTVSKKYTKVDAEDIFRKLMKL